MAHSMHELIHSPGTFYAQNGGGGGGDITQPRFKAIEQEITSSGPNRNLLLSLISIVSSPQQGPQAEEVIDRCYRQLDPYMVVKLRVAQAERSIYESPQENNKTPIATNLFDQIMNIAIRIPSNSPLVDVKTRQILFINRFIVPPAELIEAMHQMGIKGREDEVREPFQNGFLNSFGTLPKPLREYIVSNIFGFGDHSDLFYKWMCATEKKVNPFLAADAAGSPLVMLKELMVNGVKSTKDSLDEEDLTHVQNMIAQLCQNGQYTLLPRENGVVMRLIFRNNIDGTAATAAEKLARIEDLLPIDYGHDVQGEELTSHQLLFKKLTNALNRITKEGINTNSEMILYNGIMKGMEHFRDYILHCQQ